MEIKQIHWFINYLYKFDPAEDREVFAVFRRGLGKPPGSVCEMYRYIPFTKAPSWVETVRFMMAPLFALHPAIGNSDSFGTVMAKVLKKMTNNAKYDPKDKSISNVERRFWRLLSSHSDDLYEQLAHLVSLIKSNDIPIDWNDLYWVLCRWQNDNKRDMDKKRWAKDFYWELTKKEPNGNENENTNEDREAIENED